MGKGKKKGEEGRKKGEEGRKKQEKDGFWLTGKFA